MLFRSDVEQAQTVGDEDPFFILYTGGTTGESKGALHTHKSAYFGMLNQTVAERIVPSDVYMLTGQMFHIPVLLAMNYTAHGCPMVLMNFDAKLALDLIQQERVSGFLGITTMLNWMMAVENFDKYDLSSLRCVQYGGGPMPSTVIKEVLNKLPCQIIQGYGQTEGTTMTFLSQEDHIKAAIEGINEERLKSCGREGFVTSVKVVDKDGNPVPNDGETPGEIIKQGEWPNERLYKKYRGSASLDSKLDRGESNNIEGNSKIVEYKGKVFRIISDIRDGLRSSFSYVGASNLLDFQAKCKFVRTTQAGQVEAKPHLLG